MAVPDHAHPSWICRTEAERARFLDLHHRMLAINTRLLLTLVVLIGACVPFLDNVAGLVPAAAGMILFGAIQRNTDRFERPELWVFGALLGAEAMIVLAISVTHGLLTTSMALLCWPVAGLAGRYADRVARVGLAYAAVLSSIALLANDSGALTRDPLSVALFLFALVATHTVAGKLRDSDVEHRSAATLDPLTGLLNRAALRTRTLEIEAQSQLSHEPVSVILLDLDKFKRVNDDHGHAAGDAVLQEVAYRLRKRLRAYDLAYRLGGEEFVVLLLGGTTSAARTAAEELRVALSGTAIAGLDITASIGVAGTTAGTSFDWDEVYARADAALYRAKADGRDRVVVDDEASQDDLLVLDA